MRTLSSELADHAARVSGHPRVYIDANVPANLVSFMRTALQWDALFVLEHDDLRRAADRQHFDMARQLGRTLITFDRDYLDDDKFPVKDTSGVLVLTAPEERGFMVLLGRIDRELFRRGPLPLAFFPHGLLKLAVAGEPTQQRLLPNARPLDGFLERNRCDQGFHGPAPHRAEFLSLRHDLAPLGPRPAEKEKGRGAWYGCRGLFKKGEDFLLL